jgi:insulysin
LDQTCFYFEVNKEGFKETLDIFGNFFIEPLLDEKYVNKEVNAVNSEHQKNLTNDFRKVWQLKKYLADPKSNYSLFPTGNLETLSKPGIVE